MDTGFNPKECWIRTFKTPAEAEVFAEGVEVVNDSAIEAWIDKDDKCSVIIYDRDYRAQS